MSGWMCQRLPSSRGQRPTALRPMRLPLRCCCCICALLASAPQAAAAVGCTDDHGCGLAGRCVSSACVCDAWATGERCTLLNARPAATSRAFYRPNSSSWGGSPTLGTDGRYHMYASSFINHCGFSAWEHNSEVVHASSANPEGPFIADDIASPPWTHNPTVTRTNDTTGGLYVLYHLGVGRPNGSPHTNCSRGVTHGRTSAAATAIAATPPPPVTPLLPSVSWSTSPSGPWQTQSGTREGWALNNPAAYFWSNGSVFMLYKAQCDEDPHGHSFCRQFAVANCETFKGPCTPLRKIPIYGEDAGLFRDPRGNFHIFFHGGNCESLTHSRAL